MKVKIWYQDYFFWIYIFLFINAFLALTIHFWLKVLELKINSDFLAMEFFSYWSMQTTIMILFYSVIKIINYFYKCSYLKWIDNFHLKNFITFSNIISMLTYYAAIIIGPPENEGIYAYRIYWFITTLMHFNIPVVMIIYFCLTVNDKISLKQFFIKYGFIYLIYPIFYLIFVIVRAELLLINLKYEYLWKDIYPYWFFDYRERGISTLVWSIIGFAFSFYLFGLLLILTNNAIYNRKIKKVVI